jgi:predicted Zn-dependent protease
VYRDWDVFAPCGMALALVAAWALAGTFERAPGGAWLALAATLAAAAPTVQGLALASDPERSLARIEARLAEAPWVEAEERASGFDLVGLHYLGMDRPRDAERVLAMAVAAAPHPRLIVEWGVALLALQDYGRARVAFLRAAELNPQLIGAWKGLATAASALGDRVELARAAAMIEQLNPGDPLARDARRELERTGEAPGAGGPALPR